MILKLIFTGFLILSLVSTVLGQDTAIVNGFSKRVFTINRTNTSPKIDGNLDDYAWRDQPIATNFTERLPINGKQAPQEFRTEVKIVYDDQAIYFGVMMYDPEPDSILKELTERDQVGNDDFFFLVINGYNDGQQAAEFIVTAAGVQWDGFFANGNEDPSWNSIWNSDVSITDEGWVLEIRIPYRELRFPEKPIQEWGFNMEREVRRIQTRYSYNYVDNTKGSFFQYNGILRGIKNIQTPVRLSLFPYTSTYVNNVGDQTQSEFYGGMDLKYGINDAFTLDVALIPDFGQAGFDEVILNLGPFEQRFQEQRQFFIEGTDMLTKGDLFFSRRIGGSPSGVLDLTENEEVIKQSNSVITINLLKVSGRSNNGLGIGILNGVTEKTYATLENTETRLRRKAVSEPLTNYNVISIDQRLKNNSSVSFVNTNVVRAGNFRDANTSGIYASFNSKQNKFRYYGGLENSFVFDKETLQGNELEMQIENIEGEHRFSVSTFLRTKEYDIDDLGFTGAKDYVLYRGFYRYNALQPKGKFNYINYSFRLDHRRRLSDGLFSRTYLDFNSEVVTRNFNTFGFSLETNFNGENDLFEAREVGRHFKIPGLYRTTGYYMSDSRNIYRLEVGSNFANYFEPNRFDSNSWITHRFRLSDKFNFRIQTTYTKNNKQEGFADRQVEEIIFGERNRNTITNSLNGRYSFDENMILNLTFRHYYSEVKYAKYFALENDGSLRSFDYSGNQNNTFNTWNVDLRYSWWFAPGSQLSILYRNAISNSDEDINLDLRENFVRLFDAPITHNISFRLVYFLDYPKLKKLTKLRHG